MNNQLTKETTKEPDIISKFNIVSCIFFLVHQIANRDIIFFINNVRRSITVAVLDLLLLLACGQQNIIVVFQYCR